MHRTGGFTLIEIAISVFILMLLMLLAIPSVSGVMADRRLQRSLTAMNDLVHQAQEHSVQERRPYLLVWQKDAVVLRPEALEKSDGDAPVAQLALDRDAQLRSATARGLAEGRAGAMDFLALRHLRAGECELPRAGWCLGSELCAAHRPRGDRSLCGEISSLLGFALYEVLLGLTIFVVGVLALGRAVENCLNASELSEEENRVRQVLE